MEELNRVFPILKFLSSADDDGRRCITTIGMSAFNLPELKIHCAANHCRAAQLLLNVTSRRLVSLAEEDAEALLVLLRAGEPIRINRSILVEDEPFLLPDEAGDEQAPVTVAFFEETFDGDLVTSNVNDDEIPDPAFLDDDDEDEDSEELPDPFSSHDGYVPEEGEDGDERDSSEVKLDLLSELLEQIETDDVSDFLDEPVFLALHPPKDWTGSVDEWLRTACRRLGQDTPEALPDAAFDGVMDAAFDRFRNVMPEYRAKFAAGLSAKLNLGVKVALPTSGGMREFVWMTVLKWSEGELLARLESSPHDCPGYETGECYQVKEDQLLDVVIGSESAGIVDPGFTQRIAEEFGRTI